MLFKDAEALLEFVNSHEKEFKDIFKISDVVEAKKECECGDDCECKKEKVVESIKSTETSISTTDIIVESLSANPSFKLSLTEKDENIFFVKDYNATPGTCGNGSIVLNDRTSHMNMCENDNVATIELTVIVEGKRISNIPFILSRTNEEPHILLSKKHLL